VRPSFGDVLRVDGLPFITRLPGLPDLPRGQRLELDILGTDTVDLSLQTRIHQILAAQAVIDEDEEELADDAVDASPEVIAERSTEALAGASTEPPFESTAESASNVPSSD
jgi:hypothetical protein